MLLGIRCFRTILFYFSLCVRQSTVIVGVGYIGTHTRDDYIVVVSSPAVNYLIKRLLPSFLFQLCLRPICFLRLLMPIIICVPVPLSSVWGRVNEDCVVGAVGGGVGVFAGVSHDH